MTSHSFCPTDGSGDLRVLYGRVQVFFVSTTPVDLDEVKSPLGELKHILVIVSFTSRMRLSRFEAWPPITAACFTSVGVDPHLEPKTGNVFQNVGHISGLLPWRQSRPLFRVDYNVPSFVARTLPPAFVNVDVLIADLFQSGRNEGFGLPHNYVGIDGYGKAVPR